MRILRFLYSLDGRVSLKGIWLFTISAAVVLQLLPRLLASAPIAIATAIVGMVNLALIWPSAIAVPVKRFHDLGRSGRWAFILFAGAALGMIFIFMDLASLAPTVGMTGLEALLNFDAYYAAMTQQPVIGDDPAGLTAIGWGGFSLALIFSIIGFGITHLIPGEKADNRFGPRPERFYTFPSR
ncbi:DUF805 domain-containing protein [Parvularcula sp. LCG005]|uniref:DUF805 domain-containing protein n=1 Tax=Parvularcula sp. LCG005 TaxID=3078805 RepID=UPI002943ACAE|nr:DUF805 domain-containing protein [Parvularcula sp. LCG005]WOI54809.1 DUF805 domain-containing protein [Parvularcula sp. LCG005]